MSVVGLPDVTLILSKIDVTCTDQLVLKVSIIMIRIPDPMMASQLTSHELYTVPLFLHNSTDILKLRQKVMSLQSQVQIAVPPEKKPFLILV